MTFRNITRYSATTLALAIMAATPALSAESVEPQKEQAGEASTVLLVNGKEITPELFSLHRSTKRIPQGDQVDNKKMQSAVLNELVNLIVLSQDAESKGLDKKSLIQAQLDFTRIRLLANQAMADYLKQHEVSEADLRQAFDQRYKGKKSQESRVRHILSATEEEAQSVIAELKAGKDFAELAKTRSSDTSASNGGELGWLSPGQIDSAVDEALKNMKAGEFSEQPVKSKFGWHVLLVEEVRDLPEPTFAEMRDSLKQGLQQQRVSEYIKALREKAQLETKKLTEEK